MIRYEKKVTILASVLGGLLLIWGAGLIFSPDRLTARSESVRLLAGKTADVASLTIDSGTSLTLAKDGNSWFLVDGQAKLPAQARRVQSLLDALAAVDRLKPLASSKDAWPGFGLEEGKAKRLVAKDTSGKVLCDISVGGYGPTGGEVYLRRAGSDESYSTESTISTYVGDARTSWLELRLFPAGITEADVQSLSVKASIAVDGADKPKLSFDYSLARDGVAWKGPGKIDTVAVESLIRGIGALEGQDIVAAPPTQAFTPVAARIELVLGKGGSQVVEVGSSVGEGRFYARVTGTGLVYQASSYALKNVLKAPVELATK